MYRASWETNNGYKIIIYNSCLERLVFQYGSLYKLTLSLYGISVCSFGKRIRSDIIVIVMYKNQTKQELHTRTVREMKTAMHRKERVLESSLQSKQWLATQKVQQQQWNREYPGSEQ